MATPRSKLVDSQIPLYYHITSRCVQHAWLLGKDPDTGRDYSHRKQWLLDRMHHLGQFFAIEIAAFAVMSNHFHLVVYFDPKAALSWSPEEVARRWVNAFPPNIDGTVDAGLKALMYEELLEDSKLLEKRRASLGSLSCFMQHLKQPIAWRANRESERSGDFWASRFYSGALLDQDAVVAAMAYVDLNPVRAKIAKSLEAAVNTSIAERLAKVRYDQSKLDTYLAPIASGLDGRVNGKDTGPKIRVRLRQYIDHLRTLIAYPVLAQTKKQRTQIDEWMTRLATLSRPQRAYGHADVVRRWQQSRGFRNLEITF